VLPGLDFLGWHGEHYVVVRRTGERRHLDGRRENDEEGEAEEEVELKELPCRRHLDCGKGVDVRGEDATWLKRKDVLIDYEMLSEARLCWAGVMMGRARFFLGTVSFLYIQRVCVFLTSVYI
jgi:hypothetical protein